MWFVYIIECADGSLYTGITTDVERRLREHSEGKIGARYTRGRGPLILRYKKVFPDRSEAAKEEWRIKKLGRREKEILFR